jgi:1,4-dihydroxy-2-naphthoate octaprenyltransferase
MRDKTKVWLGAMRLRTLPLAASSTILGSFLAAFNGIFNWKIFTLATLTTLFLQILSNLANDYGDGVKGTDEKRVGEKRANQSGIVSKLEMKIGISILIILSLAAGILLILEGTKGTNQLNVFIFLILGFGAIFSAVKYTIGDKPYGYIGLGDFFVFFWFGIIGVAGTYFLHTHQFSLDILLPSASIGLLSVGVLNINNLRDRITDKEAGKITLVVRIGENNAKKYQLGLITLAMICSGAYVFLNYNGFWQFLFLATAPFFFINAALIMKITEPAQFDPYLKKFAISTFFFSIMLGLGLILSLNV